MSTEKLELGEVVTAAEAKACVDGGGSWIEIDADHHGGALLAVWRMEDETRSPACEERAQRVVACWNACQGFTTEELQAIAEWKAACRASDNARAHATETRAPQAIERFKNQAGAALMQNKHDACTECGSFDCNGECMGDGRMGD